MSGQAKKQRTTNTLTPGEWGKMKDKIVQLSTRAHDSRSRKHAGSSPKARRSGRKSK